MLWQSMIIVAALVAASGYLLYTCVRKRNKSRAKCDSCTCGLDQIRRQALRRERMH